MKTPQETIFRAIDHAMSHISAFKMCNLYLSSKGEITIRDGKNILILQIFGETYRNFFTIQFEIEETFYKTIAYKSKLNGYTLYKYTKQIWDRRTITLNGRHQRKGEDGMYDLKFS